MTKEPADGAVPGNALIASAMRTALIVVMLMGLPLIGLLVYLNLDKAKQRPGDVEVTRPATQQVTTP